MTYPDAVAWLDQFANLERRPDAAHWSGIKLERVQSLLAELGDPQRGLRVVHIAGSKGKGSVAAMIDAMLRAAGYHTGLYTSPHLVSPRERIRLDGEPIERDTAARLITQRLKPAVEARQAAGETELSWFDLHTALAFCRFAEADVDWAGVEVGLGGRLDATNAWDGGVAAITNVALDHTEHLGPTVAAIAREKAAIIKRGDLAVTGATDRALTVIRRRAGRVGAPLTITRPLDVLGSDRTGQVVVDPALGGLRLGLLGAHQAANAAVALAILEALGRAGIAQASADSIRRGLAEARWPGRLELLRVDGVDVLLDGAHNVDGARALAAAFDDLGPHLGQGRATLLLGVLADKDVPGILDALRTAPALRDALVLATPVPDSARALEGAALARAWGEGARPMGSADEALDEGLVLAASVGGPLVVAGSLYLVGHVRGRLSGGAVP